MYLIVGIFPMKNELEILNRYTGAVSYYKPLFKPAKEFNIGFSFDTIDQLD